MNPFAGLKVSSGHVAIQWFGQNSFAFKASTGGVLQVDPYFPRVRPSEKYIYAAPPLDEAELPTDHVLVTHDHSDHTCIESLLRIHRAFPACRFVGPRESADRMLAGGISGDVAETIRPGDTRSLGAWRVLAFWSKPPGGVPGEGIPKPDKEHLGYVLESGGMRVYVTGDLINTFADHDELVAPVAAQRPDVAVITMHPTEGEFPYFDGAVRLALKLGVKAVVPSHYECFVKRTYDPRAWAALLPPRGPRPLLIPYGGSVIYPAG
jgi:L-ascorbate metabolism protein UlaG (beta-lactamase superfamily)